MAQAPTWPKSASEALTSLACGKTLLPRNHGEAWLGLTVEWVQFWAEAHGCESELTVDQARQGLEAAFTDYHVALCRRVYSLTPPDLIDRINATTPPNPTREGVFFQREYLLCRAIFLRALVWAKVSDHQ